ncbi:hypothetical protein [Streptomyces sp. CA-111067]|uniref:hypothetical protein n=1 Tax=Streptomyces sp. CA-111067 TaxID=3240046 RepID=UPI003D96A480
MLQNASRSTRGLRGTRSTRRTRGARLATVAAVLATATAAAAPAAPAAAPAPAPRQPYHCVITLHGLAEPSARCGAAAATRAGRAGTLLMTVYKDAGYSGDSTDVRDSAGPCGIDGYGIPDVGELLGRGWNDSISSFRVFGRCTVVRGFRDSVYGGPSHIWTGDQPYVGDQWNDRISSFVTQR